MISHHQSQDVLAGKAGIGVGGRLKAFGRRLQDLDLKHHQQVDQQRKSGLGRTSLFGDPIMISLLTRIYLLFMMALCFYFVQDGVVVDIMAW